MSGRTPRILILGGGIAGLAAAWECHRQGLPATVLEAQGRCGGVVRTDRDGDFVLDAGPDAFLASKPGAIDLCRELGIESHLIGMKPPRGAYVLRAGQLHALPDGGAFGIATRPGPFLRSTLLSVQGKLRLAIEPLVPRKRTHEDESAGAFFRRRFGSEATTRLAQPLLGGIHVGDIDRLSAEAVLPQLVSVERAGQSVLLALARQSRRPMPGGAFRSFPGGMITLVDALVAALPSGTVRLDAPVDDIRYADRWMVHTADGATHGADVLVLAAPAMVVRRWLAPVQATAAELAAGIRYVSSAGVLAAFRDDQIARPLRGSGYVSVPGAQGDRLLATSWLSNKWEGRAPRGFTLLRGFFGGAFDEAVLESGDEDLVARACASWSHRFGVQGDPVLTRVVRWNEQSPQHDVGHAARVRRFDDALAALPAVAACGSGFRAVGIPDVISDARAVTRGLIDRWRAT